AEDVEEAVVDRADVSRDREEFYGPTSGWTCIGPRLLRPVEAVSRVAEARDDEAAVVQPAVDGGADDMDVRMLLVDVLDSGRRGDDADQRHALGAGVLDRRDRRGAGVARGEHRVEHDGVPLV